MCDPVSIGAFSAMAGAKAGAAYSQTAAQRRALEYQSAVAVRNSMVAELAAQDADRRGQIEEANVRTRTAELASRQRAVMAANGIALDEGSPLNVLASTLFMGENDALTVDTNKRKEVARLRGERDNLLTEAEVLRLQAKSQKPLASAAFSLLDSATLVASANYRGTGSVLGRKATTASPSGPVGGTI